MTERSLPIVNCQLVSHCRLLIANCRLVLLGMLNSGINLKGEIAVTPNCQSAIGNW